MEVRDHADAGAELHRRSRRINEARGLVAVLAAALAAVAFLAPQLVVPVAAALTFQVVMWTLARSERGTTIAELATRAESYGCADVREFGDSLTTLAEREGLARWFSSLLNRRADMAGIHLPSRLDQNLELMQTLIADLRDSDVEITPTAAAECRRLLSRAAESPLYNPYLPAENLRATLMRITAGSRRDAQR